MTHIHQTRKSAPSTGNSMGWPEELLPLCRRPPGWQGVWQRGPSLLSVLRSCSCAEVRTEEGGAIEAV